MNYATQYMGGTNFERALERTLMVLPLLAAVLLLLAFSMEAAHAALPWEGPLCMVATSLKGPVAKSIAVIAIVICGLLMAVGEMSGMFKSLLGLLMGVSMALLATSWLGIIDSSATGIC
ncbi:TrbC/VirB2 family protein [Azonexus hydrophilus]|uniref:TrbC/VirB2 family protein n=1 Tax=Azonexus hydrophilus TaxID=418702 RepID=A0ABZ2XLJ8_9RHOO